MKTAEDFRRDLGNAEESFACCVRQTLMDLEQKEEKPVKKKIRMGLALVMAIMLLTAGALAAEAWGIVHFLTQQGKPAAQDQLLELQPTAYGEGNMVRITIEEGLYDAGRLYLAVSAEPITENTLVVPKPYIAGELHLDQMSMRDALHSDAYAQDLSVMAYAQEKGFAHVIVMDMRMPFVSSYSNQSKDKFNGLEYIEYDLMEDGTLRCIMEIDYTPDPAFCYPERTDHVDISAMVYKYSLEDPSQFTLGMYDIAGVNFQLYAGDNARTDRKIRTSIAADAHDIHGYRGAIEYISFTPYDDFVAVTFMLDMTRLESDHSWMSGPALVLMDQQGSKLCQVELSWAYDVYFDKRCLTTTRYLYHGTIPAEFMPGDTVTLRLQNPHNSKVIYDEYTYTLE